MLDFAQARRSMVDCQLRTFDVHDIPLLTAFDEVPREHFVPAAFQSFAYSDQEIPLSNGAPNGRRTMLKPMFLARMIQEMEVRPGEKALDVACGLGYGAAILSRLGAKVMALESTDAQAATAAERLALAGLTEVKTLAGPLEDGFPDGAPYDLILINGLVEMRPQALLDQLAEGGRLACIERRSHAGRAVLYVRSGDSFGSRVIFDAGAPVLPGFKAEPGFVF